VLFTILNRFCNPNGSIVYCEKEQILNSKEYSELARTLTLPTKMIENERLADVQAIGINMMLFNNGYDVTIMNTSGTQLIMQPVVSSLDPVSDTTTACQNNLITLISIDIQSIVLSQSKAMKYSIYPYFSSTLEVSIAIAICLITHTKYNRG